MSEGAASSPLPRAFVTGWPIAHSRSPMIHRSWLAEFAIAGTYDPVAVEPQSFADFLRGLRTAGFAGGNVTIPHKEAAFALVDRRDAAAEAIGAVNTLWFEGEALIGGNTDSYGFAANLDERLAGWRDAERALVLGAGGAARAVVHALVAAGVPEVRVVNRTLARAEAIAADFGRPVVAVDALAEADELGRADLLVNTRPTGKAGGTSETPLDLSHVRREAMATDIVYVPLETPFLRAARERGLRTADGLGMLLHQAVPGFERWFGHRPTVGPALRAAIERDILRA